MHFEVPLMKVFRKIHYLVLDCHGYRNGVIFWHEIIKIDNPYLGTAVPHFVETRMNFRETNMTYNLPSPPRYNPFLQFVPATEGLQQGVGSRCCWVTSYN